VNVHLYLIEVEDVHAAFLFKMVLKWNRPASMLAGQSKRVVKKMILLWNAVLQQKVRTKSSMLLAAIRRVSRRHLTIPTGSSDISPVARIPYIHQVRRSTWRLLCNNGR